MQINMTENSSQKWPKNLVAAQGAEVHCHNLCRSNQGWMKVRWQVRTESNLFGIAI